MATPKWFGASAPFISGTSILPLQADERLIKNDLVQLLMTVPGERVMRPTFGTPLRLFTFEPLHSIDLTRLRDDIESAIRTFEKRVIVRDVDLEANEEQSQLNVKVIATTTLPLDNTFLLEVGIPLGADS